MFTRYIFSGIATRLAAQRAFNCIPTQRVTAIKLRKKLPLLLERVGVRRIKIRQKALFDPLILAFSRREKGLSILNLMAVTQRVGTR
jgi:hypothetical protein